MSPRKTLARRPVERQETRRGSDQRRRQQGGERVPAREEDARSGHDGLQGGQAVDSVEKVVEVHHRHDPEDRGGRGQRAQVVLQQRRQRHTLEPPHPEHDQAHHAELSHEAREGGQAGTIVGQPDERQGDAAQQDRNRARVVGPERLRESECDEHRDHDRRTPTPRDDRSVRRAHVGSIQEAPASGDGSNNGRAGGRQEEGNGQQDNRGRPKPLHLESSITAIIKESLPVSDWAPSVWYPDRRTIVGECRETKIHDSAGRAPAPSPFLKCANENSSGACHG